MQATPLNWKLTVYIPNLRIGEVKHLLPPAYTTTAADGYWQGNREPVTILTVYGAHMGALARLRLALVYTLLDCGEEAVLAELAPARGRLFYK